MEFRRYVYPLKNKDGSTYYGSYTIKSDVQPLKLQGEKMVQIIKTEDH